MEGPKVKIISGWSDPGGSTVAFINLCNLFNDNGIECTYYGPHKWHLNKCNSASMDKISLAEDDNVLTHFIRPGSNLKKACRRHVLSCHETNMYPLAKMIKDGRIKKDEYSFFQYVSESQREWHRVFTPYQIIPNVISEVKPSKCSEKVAGVIGSIDPHKRTHLSIKRALDDGFEKVYLFGTITDVDYFNLRVLPLMSKQVEYMGHTDNKQEMYDKISSVYHSSKRETFNLVKAECQKAEVEYLGLNSADSSAEYLSNEDILNKWKEALEL